MYTATMIRTQIDLPESLHAQLHSLAKGRGTSFAQLVRQLLIEQLEALRMKDHSGKRGLQSLAKLNLTGGPSDISDNHTTYLY